MFGETKEHLFELIFMFVFMIQIRLKENHRMRINIYIYKMFIMSKYVQLFKGEKYIFFLYQMGREGKGGGPHWRN